MKGEFSRVDIELLSEAEGFNEGKEKVLALPRTLGSLSVLLDSQDRTRGVGQFRLFGGAFARGVKAQFYESGGYELSDDREVAGLIELMSIVIK